MPLCPKKMDNIFTFYTPFYDHIFLLKGISSRGFFDLQSPLFSSEYYLQRVITTFSTEYFGLSSSGDLRP